MSCNQYIPCATIIRENNRAVVTIRKHIVAQETLSGRCEGIRINESAKAGVIVSALQVVQAGFMVVDISPVAQGIDVLASILYLISITIVKRFRTSA